MTANIQYLCIECGAVATTSGQRTLHELSQDHHDGWDLDYY